MWKYLFPVSHLIYKKVFEENKPEPAKTRVPESKTVLQINLERLGRILNEAPGRKIAIIGQPGAGKSSLLLEMTDDKIVPRPDVGAQTDATDWSSNPSHFLLSRYDETVFVDVPGYDTASHPVDKFKLHFPFRAFDAFLFVFNGKLHQADEALFSMIRASGKPVCIARSYAESLSPKEMASVERDVRKQLAAPDSVPLLFVSSRTRQGVKELVQNFCPDQRRAAL
ncbi:GTPase domain-containing protein [Burkholderia gladioli]|uniref:GTPase domain-containing protein n=1 Tax=Burkholderia gladioli TaxID=28095 RepID=UPI000F81198D|nr:GTPase domain-containing protein [Burkholderia gladioli]